MIVYPTTDFDSWISEEDADSYFETRLNTDEWDSCTIKEATLQTAFRSLAELDLNIEFDDEGLISETTYTASEIAAILKDLQQAQLEQALWELKHDLDSLAVENVSLGGMLSFKFNEGEKPERYSPRTIQILRPYIQIGVVSRTR